MNAIKAPHFTGAIGTRLSLPPARGQSFIGRLMAAAAQRRRITVDLDRLSDMPDHILRDVGLDRYTIRQAQSRHRAEIFRWFW